MLGTLLTVLMTATLIATVLMGVGLIVLLRRSRRRDEALRASARHVDDLRRVVDELTRSSALTDGPIAHQKAAPTPITSVVTHRSGVPEHAHPTSRSLVRETEAAGGDTATHRPHLLSNGSWLRFDLARAIAEQPVGIRRELSLKAVATTVGVARALSPEVRERAAAAAHLQRRRVRRQRRADLKAAKRYLKEARATSQAPVHPRRAA